MPKLKMETTFSPDFVPLYVNGAIGGINVKGEIVINFFAELNRIPKDQWYELDAEGRVVNPEVQPGQTSGDPTVERRIQSGIIMSVDTAIQVHKWLGQNIEAFQNMAKPKP